MKVFVILDIHLGSKRIDILDVSRVAEALGEEEIVVREPCGGRIDSRISKK